MAAKGILLKAELELQEVGGAAWRSIYGALALRDRSPGVAVITDAAPS